MSIITPSESKMWDRLPRNKPVRLSDREINEKYDSREQRIVTESNREKLPNFVEALKNPGYMNLRPIYQRRPRWDPKRQSRLIESFIINIPVPPIFLYEQAYNSYEVMDGQQRIIAIQSFYGNRLTLTGLDLWPELNGRTYATLPSKIRAGIDRRSISSIVLVNESAQTEEEATLIKQLVFDRLNTGGIKLSRQEIRNSLYQSPLNTLTIELARYPLFASALSIPSAEFPEDKIPEELLKNNSYLEMEDVELVLRFFALRHVSNFRNSVQGFLDLYLLKGRNFNNEDLGLLRSLFIDTVTLANNIYGNLIFRPYNIKTGDWEKNAQTAFYDAVMVGLSQKLDKAQELIKRKELVIIQTKQLFIDHPPGTFTGRGNTKSDITDRIKLFSDMLELVLHS